MEAAIPLVMIYTGMMPVEMMGLETDMIDLEKQQIIGAGHKTKVRKNAAVYLPNTIIPVIETVLQHCDGKKNLFPKSEKYFYDAYYAALAEAKTRRLTPYSCRHTTATALAITEGIAPQTIKQIMRWSTTRMLDRYAHPDDKSVRDAINVLTKKDGEKSTISLQDSVKAL